MPVTHILVIIDQESDADDIIETLDNIEHIDGADIMVAMDVQTGINMLADVASITTLNRRLNG